MREAAAGDPDPSSVGARPSSANWITGFGAFVFRYRDALFPVVVVVALLLERPPAIADARSAPSLILGVGAISALLGAGLRMAVIGYVYIIRGGKDGKAYAEDLVCEGFFAHARHPLYTGNLLIAVGICLMYGSPFTLYVGVPLFLFTYLAMALNEEAFLVSKFGDDYVRYMDSVPRFIPNFRGLSASLAPYTYDWRRALRKDYGQVALTLISVVGITTWRLYGSWPEVLRPGALAAICVLGAYVVVRTLKKRRLLESD